MIELSIIVPIYNTEKYLEKCINSLIDQDLPNYEILLVNDSSPDNSQKIIDEYVFKYPTLIKGLIKENGGLGDTRNYAIPYARGKYLLFIDSDDYIKSNSLNKLCDLMNKKNLDILVFDFIKVYDEEKFIHEKSMNKNHIEDYILSTPNACNKMFRTSLFTDNRIMFPTKIWYEDLAIIPGLAKYTQKIDYINEGIYYYQFRSESIMNQVKYNPKILDMIQSLDNLSNFLKDKYDEELEYLSLQHLYYGSSLKLIPFKRFEELEKCLGIHQKNFPNWKTNKYYLEKPFLYKIYVSCLEKRYYKLCQFLLLIRKVLR